MTQNKDDNPEIDKAIDEAVSGLIDVLAMTLAKKHYAQICEKEKADNS